MPPITGNPLIDRPTQKLIQNVQGRFQDTQRQLQQQRQNIQTQAGTQRGLLESQFGEVEKGARSRELQQRAQEQRNIQDQIRSQRIRARAIGGAPSSGFLELTGRAEREGAQRLAGITGGTEQTIGQARGTFQKGLADLDRGLNEAIFNIENNLAASRREKDQQAAGAGRGGGGGGGGLADLLGQLGVDPGQVTPEQAAQLEVLFTDPLEQQAGRVAGARGQQAQIQQALSRLSPTSPFRKQLTGRLGGSQVNEAFRSLGLLGSFGGRNLAGNVQNDVVQNINQLLRR
jgi:hypothetical protein